MNRALYVAAGKHRRQSVVAASNCKNSASHLYVTDKRTKTTFLVDTGADICVYSNFLLREGRTQTSYESFAANERNMSTGS